MAWYNPNTWGNSSGNTRKRGYQNEAPNSYSSPPAVPVTFDTAMTVSACWASVRLLTETVSAMPIKCYQRSADGSRSQITDYKIWRDLKYQPNRYQTTTEFFEQIMLNLVTDGNAYILLNRTTRGISSYIPLMSSQMCVLLTNDGQIKYQYTNSNSERIEYSDKQIWHIKLFGNGLVGMSPLAYARNSIATSLATEDRVGEIARNSGKGSGIISATANLQPDQKESLRQSMQSLAAKGDRVVVLESGFTFNQIGLSPQDLQMIENRRFNVEDIARFYGVPSVLLNETSASTTWGSGIKELNMGFYKYTIRPYLERIESSLKKHILPIRDWDTIDIEFDFDSLLRASYEDRVQAKATAINSGQLSPNEARNDEGLEDKDGGDKIYLNGSLTPAGVPVNQLIKPEENEVLNENNSN